MTSNNDIDNKDKAIKTLVGIVGVILIIIAIIASIRIVAPNCISPFIAKKMVKNTNNIRNNGCVMQKGRNKYGGALYSINGQMPQNMLKLTTKDFPFHRKWSKFNQNFDVDFDKKYSKECFKVKYISTKTLWFNVDFIYDVDDGQ